MATVGAGASSASSQPGPDQLDLVRVEAERRDLGRAVARAEPVQDRVGPRVADPEVALVGLALDEVGRGRLGDDHVGHAEVARQRPDLGLEQVAERVDRGRVVGVPGEVAEQSFGLVAGAERERVQPPTGRTA